jgi:hypothetical protein
MGNVTAIPDGVVTTVKYSRPCVQISVLVMERIFKKVAPVLVILTGLAQIAQMVKLINIVQSSAYCGLAKD